MNGAHNSAEHDPYGTPLSLSVQSPFHIHSSRRDDVLAIPDSPERGIGARSDGDHRTDSGVVAEKAKSESPELTASVHDYPSSRSPEGLASTTSPTLASPQQSSTRPLERPRRTAFPLPLAATADIPQGRRPSSTASITFTKPSSHRGYHVRKNTQQHWSSQTDPTETDEGLRKGQQATSSAGRGERGHSPSNAATTSSSSQNPYLGDIAGDSRATRPLGVIAESNSQFGQLTETRNWLPNSEQVQASTSLGGISKPSLVEPRHDSPGRLSTLASSRGTVSDEQPRQRTHENIDLIRDDRGYPEEAGRTAADGLESDAPPVVIQEKSKGQISTNIERVHAAGRVVDVPVTGVRSKAISTMVVADAEAALQTTMAGDGSRDQVLRVEKSASPHVHQINALFGSQKGQSKKITSNERELRTYQNVVELDKRVIDEVNTSSGRTLGVVNISNPHQTADITKGDLPADPSATVRSRESQVSEQKRGVVDDEHQVEEESKLGRGKQGLASTTERKSKAKVNVAPFNAQSHESHELESGSVKPKRKQIEQKEKLAEPQPEGPKVTKDHKAGEKRKAEEKAKREADAVARVVAAERRKLRTPTPRNAAKRRRGVSKQADEMVATDVGVQRLLGSAGGGNQLSSSPSIRSESVGKRRSMTPLFPSSFLKPSKGALRTSQSSSIPRSVSFNDDPIAPLGLLAPAIAPPAGSKDNKDRDAADTIRDSKSASKGQPGSTLSQSKPLDTAAIVQDDTHVSGSKQPAQHTTKSTTPTMDGQLTPTTQVKLDVTRDVESEGQGQETPRPQTPVRGQDLFISSDGENSASTFHLGEEDETGSAKARPSKKRELTDTKKSTETTPDTTSETVQQPEVPSPKLPRQTVPSNIAKPVNGDVTNHSGTPRSSRSRSPAQYMSKGDSASPATASESDSPTETESNAQAASESGSQSGPLYESESGTEESASESDLAESVTSAKSSEKSSRVGREGTDVKTDNATAKLSNGTLRRPSQPALSRTHSPKKSEINGENRIAHETDQQLQREHRQSIQASQPKSVKVDKPKTREQKPTPTPASANKPNNSRFPSLTGLRGRALKADNTAAQTPKTPLASRDGSKSAAQPLSRDFEDVGSSDSDEESSSSDDRDATGQSSQNSIQITPKPQSGPIRGIKQLIGRKFTARCRVL